MEEKFTVHELIRYFEEHSARNGQAGVGAATGKEPQYPMLVVFLGGGAIGGFRAVASSLFRVWPQYQGELRFMGVERKDGGAAYTRLTLEKGRAVQEALAGEEISGMVTSLFGLRTHFQNRSKLFVYYILDTTEMANADMYGQWLQTLEDTRALLGVGELEQLDMLIMLINEDFSKVKLAKQIRNRVSEYYSAEGRPGVCDGMFLLSNRRSDNAILEDWDMCYRIASAIIILSNNSDAKISTTLFGRSVMTASYAREEKPIRHVGQVIVEALIDELAGTQEGEALPADAAALSQRLGLTRDGTPELFNQYAEQTLAPMLPDPGQLGLFPQRDEYDYGDLSRFSAREFNEHTMNAWDSYLMQLAAQAREKVTADAGMRQGWGSRYAEMLDRNFSTRELAELAGRLDEVRGMMGQKRPPSQDAPVLDAAADMLRYMLSSDEKLIQVLLDAIRAQGEKARGFLEAWKELLQTRLSVFAVRDQNLINFYRQKTRKYFDRHAAELAEGFRKLRDMGALRAFLEDALDGIVGSDGIFAAAFEEELERRMNNNVQAVDAKQYIRRKLTGSSLYTYLQVDFDMGEPVFSAILLKTGTLLHENLRENLPDGTYYYNTGCGDAAESIVFYEVDRQNLISEEGAEA